MSYELVLSIQFISVVLLAAESIYIFYSWKSSQHSLLFLYSFSTLINNLGYLMEMTAKNSDAALLGTQICYLGKVLIPLSLFGFVSYFCSMNVKKRVFAVLTAMHLFVFFLVLSCRHHRLYYTGWTYVEAGLFPHNVFGHGPVYFIYMTMMFVYVIAAAYFILKAMGKEANHNRRVILAYLLASAGVEALGFIIFLTGITQGYDVTSLSYLIATVFMLLAIFRNDLLDTLDLAKNYALDNFSEGVIATDETGLAIYSNAPAGKIFSSIAEAESGAEIEKARTEAAQELSRLIEGKKLLFKDERIYNPESRELQSSGRQKGTLFVIYDITDSYNYNKRLKREVAAKTEKLREAQESIVTGMATMVESRDNSTGGHIRRTSKCVEVFSKALESSGICGSLPEDFFQNVIKAAPMHDLGKIAVDDSVLRKPGRYTPEEFEKMKCHAANGAEIVAEILKDSDYVAFTSIAVNVAHYHHEKIDGSGYPSGLRGSDIPLEARIMALADVFDALVSRRCYKDSFSYDEAFEIIRQSLGTHFDSQLGAAFLSIRPDLEKLYDDFKANGTI